MRPKGEPAIRTVQGHAHQCIPCPTITGASNKSRENRLDLPGFLRKPEQISRFSRHCAPDGATASHAHGLDRYGHASKERPPWAGRGGFRRKAHRVPPRRKGSAPALRRYNATLMPEFLRQQSSKFGCPGWGIARSGEIYRTTRQARKTVCTDGYKRPRSDIEKPFGRSFYSPHVGHKKTCRTGERQAVTRKSPFNAH